MSFFDKLKSINWFPDNTNQEVVLGLFIRKRKCPRCDKQNINTVKAKSWMTSAIRGKYFQELFNRSKDLYVCKDCGFSWESR